MVSTQTLQAFDPSKVSIKEVADVVCHRPGTILGNFSIDTDIYRYYINFVILMLLNIRCELFASQDA